MVNSVVQNNMNVTIAQMSQNVPGKCPFLYGLPGLSGGSQVIAGISW